MPTPSKRPRASASPAANTASKKETPAAKSADRRAQKAKRASEQLKQVSDPTRLHVVRLLSRGERHVGALCDDLKQSQPAVSHHLALLRHGGVISPRREGKNNIYSLTDVGRNLSKIIDAMISD